MTSARRYRLHPPGTRLARNVKRFMGVAYPGMQLLTVVGIPEGKRCPTPTVAGRHEPQTRLPGVTGRRSQAPNLPFRSASPQLKDHTIVH